MVFYVSKVFTATAVGSCLKEVTCEKCGTHFYYELSRQGVGQGSAPYFVGQGSAQTRSQRGAADDLARRLQRDSELVPCPGCRWINQGAVDHYRKSRQRGWTWLAAVIAFLGLVTSLNIYFISNEMLGRPPSLRDPLHWLLAGTWISTAGLLLYLQRWLRRRIDPNRWMREGGARLPAGVPPALVKRSVTHEGEWNFDVIPNDISNRSDESKWATVRANQLSLAPLCCRCLEQACTAFRLPFVYQSNPMPVPLCHPCLGHLRRTWWICNLAGLIVAVLLGWCVSALPRQMDEFGRGFLGILAGGATAVIGFIIIEEAIRPYRHRWVDPDRGIAQIRFRNPAYTAILKRKIGEADGLFDQRSDDMA